MKLKIRNVGPGDFGSYRCVAKNSLGETDGLIKLDGKCAKSFRAREKLSIIDADDDDDVRSILISCALFQHKHIRTEIPAPTTSMTTEAYANRTSNGNARLPGGLYCETFVINTDETNFCFANSHLRTGAAQANTTTASPSPRTTTGWKSGVGVSSLRTALGVTQFSLELFVWCEFSGVVK